MTEAHSILEQEILAAHRQGDWARLVALCGAMSGQPGVDQGRIERWITEASQHLVRSHLPHAIETAQGWAATWWRMTRSSEARATLDDLQRRVARVRGDAERLRQAMARGDTAAIRRGIDPLMSHPDRCEGTEALLAEARTRLRAREDEALRLQELLAAGVPGALDQALHALTELRRLDPALGGDDRRADLERRAAAVEALHARIAAGFADGRIDHLRLAADALAASGDRLSSSAALLQDAGAELQRRQDRFYRAREAYSAAGADLDAGIAALEAIERLAPDAPEVAQLAGLRAKRAELARVRAQLEAGLRDPARPGLDEAIARARQLGRDDLVAIADGLAEVLAARERAAVRLRTALIAISTAMAALALIVGLAWMRDRSAWDAVRGERDKARSVELARAYLAERHWLYDDLARARIAELGREIDDDAFEAADRVADPVARVAALEAYAATPDARWADQARRTAATLRAELADRAYAEAKAAPDPADRIARLTAYARQPGARYAAQARQIVAELTRAQDDQAFAAATSARELDQRIARLEAYVAMPGASRAAEAAALLATARAQMAEQRLRDEDDARFAEASARAAPAERIAQLRAYLAREGGAHRAEAERLLAEADVQMDDEAWNVVLAARPERRVEALRAYLAGGTRLGHAAEARTRLAEIERGAEEAAWQEATVPGEPREVIARLDAYLAAGGGGHRAEAERMRRDLIARMDRSAWEAAMAPADRVERVKSLLAYLADPAVGHRSRSLEEIQRCLDWLSRNDARRFAALGDDALAQADPRVLARLPGDRLAQLPLPIQRTVLVQPPWAAEAGVDAAGRWAVLAIDQHPPLRLRYVFPGAYRGADDAEIQLLQGCWLGEAEVTQALWVSVMSSLLSRNNPSERRGDSLPVHNLAFRECAEFVQSLNRRLEFLRVPARVRPCTSLEWRFAAGAARDGIAALVAQRAQAPDDALLQRIVCAQEADAPRAAAGANADAWGLIDLIGNVAEWCASPGGVPELRGGHWKLPRADCRWDRVEDVAENARQRQAGLRLVIESVDRP